MPRVSWDQVNAASDLVNGAVPETLQPHDAEPRNALDIAASAFRQTNVATNLFDVASRPALPPPSEGYTPFLPGILTGYEQFADRFVRSGSPEETESIKGRIGQELRDQHTLHEAGGWGLAASIAAGVVDPATLLTMAIPLAAPAVWGSRTARVGTAVAAGAAVDVASEVAMHQAQELRTVGESALNVGAGAFLNGVLGAIATRVPKSEFDILRKQLGKQINESPESTAGAAAVSDFTTLADETIATPAARAIASTIGQISPLNRLLTSPLKATRLLAQRVLEVPYLLNKNLKGVPTPVAVESVVKERVNRARYELVTDYEKAFVDYSQRTAGDGARSLKAFGEEVVRALRNGDKSTVQEAQALAGKIRQTFDADRKALQELGALPEEFKLLGAESYFPRVYDRAAIAADTVGLEQRLRRWFTDHPKLVNEAEADPKVAKYEVEHTTDEVGGHTFKAGKTGAAEAQEGDGVFQMKRIDVGAEERGNGIGLAMLVRAADEAASRGLRLASDFSLSPGAQRLYEALKRRGYKIVKNVSKLNEETGNLVSADIRKGVYEVTPPEKTKPVFREPGEIESSVQETINNILGTVRGMADLGSATAPKGAKPLRSRTLDVPDEILSPYLSNDLESVMSGYYRAMVPQVEMRRAFGSASLNNEMEAITNSVNAAIAATDNQATKNALREQLSKDITTLAAMRDRVLGQTGPRNDMPSWLVKANRVTRAYNYVRLLGSQALSSLSDYGHVITRYGLVKTGAATVKFLTNIKANKLIREDAKRLGTALDWTIDTRGSTLGDIGDELGGSKVEQYAQWASRGFSRISGMATWNSSLKAITAALEQDAILRAVKNPDRISAYKRGLLANNGMGDDMLRRVAAQFEKYGDDSEGLARARTSMWDDPEAAQAMESAVVKASDMMVLTRGHGDLPLLMNNELVKTLLQFKGFGMASINRIMIPLAQGLSHGDLATANGFAAMLALGAMTYAAKEWAAGREPELNDPRRVISESLNWSGVLGFLPDVYDPAAGAFHLPRLSRYTSRMPVESLLGPTYGTATSAYNMLEKLTNGQLEQSDIHRVRQMLPLQNLFYLRRVINAVEGEAGEATGAKGATNKDFIDRVTETKLPEATK